MGILKNNLDGFLKGWREARDKEEYQKKEECTETLREDSELLIISVDNRQAVEEFIMDRTGWQIEQISKILDNLPGYIRGEEEDMLYWEKTLLDLGSNAYIVSKEENLTLKVISYDGGIEDMINVTRNALGCEIEEAKEIANDLPFYVDGAIEYVEYWQEKFRKIGADCVIMSYEDAHKELGDVNYELTLVDSGESFTSCVRIIREHTGMTLMEAKTFVDNLPDSLYGSLEVLKVIQNELSSIGVESYIPSLDDNKTEKKMSQRYCCNCGEKIVSNAKFCGNCGAKIQ